MVNLAKIRKKAKKGVGAGAPARPAGEAPAATTPEMKLANFIASAGRQRFVPQAAPAAAEDEVELLTFLLGTERYAIEIDRIAQIIATRPATSVPNAPPGVIGIVSLRGSIVTLMDIRPRLRQPRGDMNGDPRIIVIQEAGGLAGFEVDRVLRPAKVSRAAIEPQPVVDPTEESGAIRGVIRGGDALTIVLDLGKLLQ